MKIITTILIILLGVLLTGCPKSVHPLSSSEYHKYPVLYEANYDFQCSRPGISLIEHMSFTKGDRFAPFVIKDDGILKNIPENIVGLEVYEAPSVNWYAYIFTNGAFAYSIMGTGNYVSDNKDKIPFKQVKSNTLR